MQITRGILLYKSSSSEKQSNSNNRYQHSEKVAEFSYGLS